MPEVVLIRTDLPIITAYEKGVQAQIPTRRRYGGRPMPPRDTFSVWSPSRRGDFFGDSRNGPTLVSESELRAARENYNVWPAGEAGAGAVFPDGRTSINTERHVCAPYSAESDAHPCYLQRNFASP